MTPNEATSFPIRLDSRVSLATALACQPGVYAMLLGSGISTGAGVPTGWGVVENLVRRVAAGSHIPIEGDDWESWWALNAAGRELGYSQLLAEMASTPPARRALLAGFFEPTEDELADEVKTPGSAHKAIAQLVAKGIVRIIITTNFDRLLEHALSALGINPQVVATNSDVAGMEPLQHARVTIIKVNGDYGSLDQRNTVEELSSYGPAMTALLGRVFDEYGLIVSGWSGDWDTALIAAVKTSANRRYPLYWVARTPTVSGPAAEVTARSGTHLIRNATADDFFPDLVDRVEAVQGLIEAPATREVKLARLRKALPDPVRHLEVRALFEEELEALSDWARQRPQTPDGPETVASTRAHYDTVKARFATLLDLFWTGVLLDRDRQHDDLWVWVLQRAMSARVQQTGTYVEWWDALPHYPALLMLRAGTLAALAAKRESLIVRLMTEPTWNSLLRNAGPLPAYEVLHLHVALDADVMKAIARTRRPRFASSYFVREKLRPIAEAIGGGVPAATELLDRMEFRMAVASARFDAPEGAHTHGPAGGEFLRDGRWGLSSKTKRLPMTEDFLRYGDPAAWGYRPEEHSEFEAFIVELDQRLGKIAEDRY